MMSLRYILTTVAFGFIWAAASQAQEPLDAALPPRFNVPVANLVTGGQPSVAELRDVKNAGVTKVINLRGPNEEVDFNERAEVEALEMEYVSFPISGAADVTPENARKLHELLKGDEKVLLHCASGNRVGALLAIRAHDIQGKSADESLRLGRAAGLGSLDKKVESVISE